MALLKKVNSIVLLYSIYVVQVSTAVVVYNLSLITDSYLSWVLFYYVLSLGCSLPQSGFSDTYGRKKHLLISSTCVLLSVFCLVFMYVMSLFHNELHSFSWSFLTAGPVCLLLGVMGNFIPIARGGITDLKIHDFRVAIGLSTTLIGLGWITAVGLGLILSHLCLLIVTVLLQATTLFVLKFLFCDPEDLTIDSERRKRSAWQTVLRSYQWFGSMFLVTGGAAALFAYLFSESTFYPVYSVDEDGVSFGNKVVGASMAFGYGAGVLLQWQSRCSDRTSIILGVAISLISLILISTSASLFTMKWNWHWGEGRFVIKGVLDFLLAFGYGFFVPALFSVMASKIEAHHAGRLFGAVDTTDTVALSVSSGVIWLKERLQINGYIVYNFITILFLISCFFYMVFIKKFTTYERR